VPVSVELSPRQIVEGEAVTETDAFEFTVTVTVVDPVHPSAVVPVTEYVVLVEGATVTDAPVNEPGIQR